MKYPTFSTHAAKAVLEARRSGDEVDSTKLVLFVGNGEDIPDGFITSLRDNLLSLMRNYPDELAQRDEMGGAFEAEASALVHAAIPSSLGAALYDPGYWRYLCVEHFSSVVEWRHQGPDGKANIENYGVGNSRSNLLYRMWIRADVSLDVSAVDQYHLTRIPGRDLWQSHIIRVKTGNYRTLVKALLTYLYPDGSKGKCRLPTKVVRELAKRLNRLRSNILIEIYEFSDCVQLVSEEAERAKLAV